jgi:hypothetical protein
MESVRYRWACSIKVSALQMGTLHQGQCGTHGHALSRSVPPVLLMMTDDDQTMYCSIQVLCFESVPISPQCMEPHPSVAMGPSLKEGNSFFSPSTLFLGASETSGSHALTCMQNSN